MNFPEPDLKNLTNVQLNTITRFNNDLKRIFEDIITFKKKEEDYNIKTRGFRRSFEPSYRVPFCPKEEISNTKKDTLAHILKLKSEEAKRPANVSHNKDILKPGEKKENNVTKKKKINELEDDDVEVIDRNRLQSFKKQKVDVLAEKVPVSISQYSFSSKYNKPLSSMANNTNDFDKNTMTERQKYKTSENQQYLHDLKKNREVTRKTLDFLEQEYMNKKEIMKKKKEEDIVKQEMDKDKEFIEKVLGGDGYSGKSRFEGSSTNSNYKKDGKSRYQNKAEDLDSE